MIIDLQRFIQSERPYWMELEAMIEKIETAPEASMDMREMQRFHYLYRRAAADLGRIVTFTAEPETRRYLESLVARAYGEIHEVREKARSLRLKEWFFETFPQTFRRRIGVFWMSLAITVAGCIFGGLAIGLDSEAKTVIMPFPHLQGNPADRVAKEEQGGDDHLTGTKGAFAATLMTHNTKVSILNLAFGVTWGIGTVVLLFYNGVILGAVSADYILASQTKFLLGWLLPHGVVEIPAILIAGQGGLLLASALIGQGIRKPLRFRLREISRDLVTLIFGAALLLVWAGLVEAFLSQYHEPVLPYIFKIVFGLIELTLLCWFLAWAGREKVDRDSHNKNRHE